jgi:hypothetical protein
MFPVLNKIFGNQAEGCNYLISAGITKMNLNEMKVRRVLRKSVIPVLYEEAFRRGIEIKNTDFLWVDDEEPE